MCCLGHACEVSGLGKWIDNRYVISGRDNSLYTLPTSVEEWLGFDTDTYIGEHPAAVWNDDKGKTLKEIADIIEAVFPEVKV